MSITLGRALGLGTYLSSGDFEMELKARRFFAGSFLPDRGDWAASSAFIAVGYAQQTSTAEGGGPGQLEGSGAGGEKAALLESDSKKLSPSSELSFWSCRL